MCCGFIVQARSPEKKTRSERSGDGEFLCRCCVRCCKEAIRGNELAFLKIPEPSELIISQRFFFLFFEIPSISALLQTAASTSRSTFQGAGRSLSLALSIPPLFHTQSSAPLPPSQSGALPLCLCHFCLLLAEALTIGI